MSNNPVTTSVSRRDFARHVAVAATALALPEVALAQTASSQAAPSVVDVPKEVADEVEIKFNAIMKLSGPGVAGTFTAGQKDELRRQLVSQVQGLQKLRAYKLDNGDAPALVLRVEPPVFVETSSGPTLVAPERK